MKDKIKKTIEKYNMINVNDKVLVGVSGGPDSMSLLNVLYKLGYNVEVAHVNHGLRKEADTETKYVEEYCKNIGVPCHILRLDINKMAKEQKIGTEELGRIERYKFFESIEHDVIATAHNANDNAETVLLNLMRGSGTSGLKGIEAIRKDERTGSTYIRPLIECTRKEILEYCKEEKLDPKFDKSNEDNTYTRNKVRNELIPFIEKEFNPNIIETINRFSKIIDSENTYIEKQVEEAYNHCIDKKINDQIILSLKKFNNLDTVIQKRLVLYTIIKLQGTAKDISNIHVEDIVKLCNNNIGNKKLSPKKTLEIYVNRGKIYFKNI